MDPDGGTEMTRMANDLMTRSDAWSREARCVRGLATSVGLTLDEDELILQDVHDLQVLRGHLQRIRGRQRRMARDGLRRLRATVCEAGRRVLRDTLCVE